MNSITKGLLVLLGLTSPIAGADILGEVDDTYLGVQMTMPLEAKYRGIFSGRNQLNYLLIEQNDGTKDGIALTRDSNGNQILNFLRPSDKLEFIGSSFAEYAVPVFRLSGPDNTNANTSTNYAMVGLVALCVVELMVKHDLEKDWKVVE